jgi:hypothetical protein
VLGGDLGEPDGGLNGLHLTEEWADALELVVPPVLEQAGGLRAELPLVGVWQVAPGVDVLADLVDDRGGVVRLFLCGEAAARVEQHFPLVRLLFDLSRLRDRGDQI